MVFQIRRRPSKKEVFEILEFAWDKGIRAFDTAPGYGTEEILGEFIKVNNLEKDVIILTKNPKVR